MRAGGMGKTMRPATSTIACLCLLLCLPFRAPASVIHVDLNGSGDFLTIQEGIDAAAEGDTDMVCWINAERVCGIDCTAYDMRCTDDANFYPCILINMGRVAAKALLRLSSMVHDKPERVNVNHKSELNKIKPPPIGT